MTLKHYDISDDEVSERAFEIYSDSSFEFQVNFDGVFFVKFPGERAIEIGTIEDVDRYLLSWDEDE